MGESRGAKKGNRLLQPEQDFVANLLIYGNSVLDLSLQPSSLDPSSCQKLFRRSRQSKFGPSNLVEVELTGGQRGDRALGSVCLPAPQASCMSPLHLLKCANSS